MRDMCHTLGEQPSQLFLLTQRNISVMPRAELKTTKTGASVDDFINAVADEG